MEETGFLDRAQTQTRRPLARTLRHIDEEESSEVAMCETALNRSLMDSQDERPASPCTGGSGGGVTGHRAGDHYPPSPLHTHTPTALLPLDCLMIINTLKHLRSRGSELAPERAGDERRGGREAARGTYGNDALPRDLPDRYS